MLIFILIQLSEIQVAGRFNSRTGKQLFEIDFLQIYFQFLLGLLF